MHGFTLLEDDTPPASLNARPSVVAVGNFDGVHRGHKAVLLRAKSRAAELGVRAAVLTFEPHPADFFADASTIFRLTPLPAKARLIERLGLDAMVVLSFNKVLAELSAGEFVSRILVDTLRVGTVVVGYDFHFGKRRGGTPAFLTEAGAQHGFGVEIIGKVEAPATDGQGSPSSSTLTRQALRDGDVARAAELLGHAFTISGTVAPGQELGRTLGFPTANIQADPSCRLRHGIYAVRATVDGVTRPGVASWGRRPTVDNGAPLLETFLFDFSGDLYGKAMEVAFVAWLRGEETFASLDLMMTQMRQDAQAARAALAAAPQTSAI